MRREVVVVGKEQSCTTLTNLSVGLNSRIINLRDLFHATHPARPRRIVARSAKARLRMVSHLCPCGGPSPALQISTLRRSPRFFSSLHITVPQILSTDTLHTLFSSTLPPLPRPAPRSDLDGEGQALVQGSRSRRGSAAQGGQQLAYPHFGDCCLIRWSLLRYACSNQTASVALFAHSDLLLLSTGYDLGFSASRSSLSI